jgi:putative component of membrane protein insertase Oxa1/YidC/SpoIIIJ protein YidD
MLIVKLQSVISQKTEVLVFNYVVSCSQKTVGDIRCLDNQSIAFIMQMFKLYICKPLTASGCKVNTDVT